MKTNKHSICICILLNLCLLQIKAQREECVSSWVGAVWSYYDYAFEDYSYFRYTVLDRPEMIDGKTYYPLVKYTTCEYIEGNEETVCRIRQEGKKILARKEDYKNIGIANPFYEDVVLKEIGNDYILYDFALDMGEEYCMISNLPVTVIGIDSTQTVNKQILKQIDIESCMGWDTWIEGIGSTYDLLEPYTPPEVDCPCRRTLNYFCSADSCVVWQNPRTNVYTDPYDNLYNEYDHFKEDDCALTPSNIGEVADVSPFIIQANNGIISCSSSTATMFEIYTMDAIKVGEAAFANGEAIVKVGKTPATYLYIVTYPNGRRESGKVATGN